MIKSQYVSWNEIENNVQIISNKILKSSKNFSTITTISRGGLIPSRLLADSLGIEKIFVDQNVVSSDSLFVDDIFDSGKTFDKILSNVDDPSKLVFVTLFARCGKKYPKNLVYAKKTNNDAYVIFPWDKLEFQRTKK